MMLLAVVATGCDAPPEGTWVTRLNGVDAWLGVTVTGDEGAAFVCGGETAIDTHTRWMLSSATTDKVTFEDDGWKLEINLTDADAGGQLIEPDGSAVAFEARRVADDDLAGVYFGFDAGCGDGLIILDGPNADALGAWCDTTGFRAQVTPIFPIVRNGDSISAFVDIDAGRRDFVLTVADPKTVTP